MTEDEAFTDPPLAVSGLEFWSSDTVKCMTIHSQGEWPILKEVRVYHLPGHWSAVYAVPNLVRAWDWTDEHYLEAMQFALDLHKLEVLALEGEPLDPYDWMTPEEQNELTNQRFDDMQERDRLGRESQEED